MPDQFDTLQMKEFYQLWDGYNERERKRDFKQAYFTTYTIIPFCEKGTNMNDICKEIYERLHGKETKKSSREELDDIKKQFNF